MINNISAKNHAAGTKPKNAAQSNPSDTLFNSDLTGLNKQDEKNANQPYETAAILELSEETKEKLANKNLRENERAEETGESEVPRPDDNTRKLTRMLVAAKSPDEVQYVLADVYNHMREWQKLAAEGDKKAMAVVRKLNKLISRGNRKISDLNKEIIMHQRQQKAENDEKSQLSKRLENELKEAQRERKARERKYLQEKDKDDDEEEASESGPTMAETEAKIRQLAAAMAAIKTNAVTTDNYSSFESASTSEAGSIESAEVSGEGSSESE